MKTTLILTLTSLLSAATALSASHHNNIQHPRASIHLERRLGLPIDENPFATGGSPSADASVSASASASASRSSLSLASLSRASASSSRASASASEQSKQLSISQAEISRSLASISSVASSLSRASATSTSSQSGSTTYITSTIPAPTPTATDTTTLPEQSLTPQNTNSSSQGSSKALIIGVSVAGGVLILAFIFFLYFKFGGKRFSGYEDNDADIKWPEFKSDPDSAAMQPLPARRTGGAGFDMGDDSDNGHEPSIKARDSFTASTTAFPLNDSPYPPPIDHAGYLPNPHPHQPIEPAHYYDMTSNYHSHLPYPDPTVYPDANSYDPYATAGARPLHSHHTQYI